MKVQWLLLALFSGRRLTFQFSLCRQTVRFFPGMSLAPLKLLPQCWSSGWVCLFESSANPYMLPLRGAPGTSEALCLTQPKSLVVFTAWSTGGFCSDTALLGWGDWFWAGTSSSSEGIFAAKIFLFILNDLTWVCNQLVQYLPLTPRSLTWLLLYVFGYRTFVQIDFRWSQWLFCRLVVIVMWSWEEVSIACTYFAILTKSLYPTNTKESLRTKHCVGALYRIKIWANYSYCLLKF